MSLIVPRFKINLGGASLEPTVASNVYTKIPFSTAAFDPDGYADLVNHVVTPCAGLWLFCWQAWCDANLASSGNSQLVAKLVKGTGGDVSGAAGIGTPSGAFPSTGVAQGVAWDACDGTTQYWINLYATGISGGAVQINTHPEHTVFSGMYLGPTN